MSIIGKAAGALVSPIAKAIYKAVKPKGSPAPTPAGVAPILRRNNETATALERRRGSASNQRTGPRGAEAPGSKTKLGQ